MIVSINYSKLRYRLKQNINCINCITAQIEPNRRFGSPTLVTVPKETCNEEGTIERYGKAEIEIRKDEKSLEL